MKNTIRLFLVIFGLCLSATGWAANQLVVQFSGVTGKASQNVNLVLQNLRSQMIGPVTVDGVQNFYKKAPDKIKTALQPYGYFRASVRSKLTRKNNTWVANFYIAPGPPIRITQLDLDIIGPGVQDPAFKRLRQHFPLKVGHVLHTAHYEKAKQLLYDLASTRGYFDAKLLKSKIYINLKTYQVKLVFKFKTGRRYLFGYTIFSDTPFSLHFLNKFLTYKEGQAYNYHKIQKTQEALINSNYFNQVIVTPTQKEAVNYAVPIKIKLIPVKRSQYTFGLGYGTDTGPRGTLGYTLNRVNAYGHRFNALIQGAEKYSKVSANYLIPGPNPATDAFTFSAGYGDFEQITGNGNSRKLSASYTTALSEWQQTIALTYLNERYNIVRFPFTKTRVLYPSIHWKYLSTQKLLHPKNGFAFSSLIAGTTKSAVSETGFSLFRTNFKLIRTVFKHTRIILRTSLARANINNLEKLPFSLQLFAGGARSIRGYRYNAIGPGRNLFTASTEIQQRIKGNFYLVGFFDVGNVSDKNPFDKKDLFLGVGPGIAWLSPIGVLEITFANAISQPNRPWVVQFTMGPEL